MLLLMLATYGRECPRGHEGIVLIFGTFTNWCGGGGRQRAAVESPLLVEVCRQLKDFFGSTRAGQRRDYYIYDGNRINGPHLAS